MAFQIPPAVCTEQGRMRRVGFEIEFAGVSVPRAAGMIVRLFGGRDVEVNQHHHRVEGTSLGEFVVALDWTLLKNRRHHGLLAKLGIDVDALSALDSLEALAGKVIGAILPNEIVTPPLPLDSLDQAEAIATALRREHAEGTQDSPLYAFGLHINAEAPSLETASILAYLRAFLLLEGWLRAERKIDVARRISPFIDECPEEYRRLVLAADYRPGRQQLVEDYLRYNATRNRALDLQPLLAWLDEPAVMARTLQPRLIKRRPAYHYRLPNCRVGDSHWHVADEWNAWAAVERLAADGERLGRMASRWREVAVGGGAGGRRQWVREASSWL